MSASPALSDSPSQIQSAMANGVHRKYVIGKSALRGAQYASLAASPLYLAYAWRKQSFSLRGLARANWLVPLTGGALVGAYAAQMSSGASDQATYAQAQSMRLDAAEVKAEDTFVVSAVLGSLLLPAIFLKRVGLVNGLLGGVGMGGGIGLVYNWVDERLQTRTLPSEAVASAKIEPALQPQPKESVPVPVPRS